jgi:transcription antitermination factor NusG
MLMASERKAPGTLRIGDVVGLADLIAPDDPAAKFPLGSCCHDQWAADWYAVLTKPGREGAVDIELRKNGYRCFYPKRLIEIRVPGFRHKRETVRRPLYPRYVFAGVPIGVLELTPVYYFRGVAGVLGSGGDAIPIRIDVMERLMRRADRNGVVEITEVPAEHLFSQGQVVGFKAESLWHPFKGTIGRVDSNGMIEIHIDSATRSWPVTAHYSELLPPDSI